jgi:AraC-like DNA-binding protein
MITSKHGEHARSHVVVLRTKFSAISQMEEFLANNYDPTIVQPLERGFGLNGRLLLMGELRMWAIEPLTAFEMAVDKKEDRYWVCLPAHGSATYRFEERVEEIRHGQGWIREAAGLRRIRVPAGYFDVSFDVPRSVVDSYLIRCLEHDAHLMPLLNGTFDTTYGNGRLIASLVGGMIRGADRGTLVRHSPLAARTFSDLILDLLVHGVIFASTNAASKLRGSPPSRSIQRAVEYIEANLHRPLTIADIAEIAAVSPRALQIGFQREFACSPLRYARNLRLARVRAELLAQKRNARIAEVAARWGFFHLGLFARQYREQYGESPSETTSD